MNAYQAFFRHASASGCTIQELLSYKDVSPMVIYTHVLNRGGRGVRSPADDYER